MITPELIAQLRAAHAAATPGEWKVLDKRAGGYTCGYSIWQDLERPYADSPRGKQICTTPDGSTQINKDNMILMALLHNLAPALLDALENATQKLKDIVQDNITLQIERGEARAECERLRAQHTCTVAEYDQALGQVVMRSVRGDADIMRDMSAPLDYDDGRFVIEVHGKAKGKRLYKAIDTEIPAGAWRHDYDAAREWIEDRRNICAHDVVLRMQSEIARLREVVRQYHAEGGG